MVEYSKMYKQAQLHEPQAPATDSEQYEVVSNAHKQEAMEMQTNAPYVFWIKQ